MFIDFFSYFMEYCGIEDVIVNSNKFELILNRSFYSTVYPALNVGGSLNNSTHGFMNFDRDSQYWFRNLSNWIQSSYL